MFKKLLFGLIGSLIFAFSFSFQSSFAQVNTDFPYVGVGHEGVSDDKKTENSIILHKDVIDEEKGYIQRLLDVMGLSRFAYGTDPESGNTTGAHNYIIYIFNILIAISAFIALLFVIYGFGKMFFSSDEKSHTSAVKIIKNSAIAIAIIGLSWFVVSFLFYFFAVVNDVNTDTDDEVRNITNTVDVMDK